MVDEKNTNQVNNDTNYNINESKKIKRNKKVSIFSNIKRILTFSNLISLCMLLFGGFTPFGTLIQLQGISFIMNNFPIIGILASALMEVTIKLGLGAGLNNIYNLLFNRGNKYNSEVSLQEDIIKSQIELDKRLTKQEISLILNQKLKSNNIISENEILENKIDNNLFKNKISELEYLITKRHLISSYSSIVLCDTKPSNDEDIKKIHLKISILVRINVLILIAVLSHFESFGVIFPSNIILYAIPLLFGGDFINTIVCSSLAKYKSKVLTEAYNNLKSKLGEFNIHREITIAKREYDDIKKKIAELKKEIVELYYQHYEKEVKENNSSNEGVQQSKVTLPSRRIAPIDRSLESPKNPLILIRKKEEGKQ